jgi:hypothetical protein
LEALFVGGNATEVAKVEFAICASESIVHKEGLRSAGVDPEGRSRAPRHRKSDRAVLRYRILDRSFRELGHRTCRPFSDTTMAPLERESRRKSSYNRAVITRENHVESAGYGSPSQWSATARRGKIDLIT